MNFEKIKEEAVFTKGSTDIYYNIEQAGGKPPVFDSSLEDFDGYFETVLPDSNSGIEGYLKHQYKGKEGELIGIELGGPGCKLFKELDPLFKKTAGFTLHDNPDLPRTMNHEVVEADVFSKRIDKPNKIAGYQKVEEWVHKNGKADFVVERMVAGVASLNIDYFNLVLRRWYELLSPEGTAFIQFPALDPNQQLLLLSQLNLFLGRHSDKFEFNLKNDPFSKNPPFFVLRLRKLPGAQDSLSDLTPNTKIELGVEDASAEYMKVLELTDEDVRGKKILDIGCGLGGFAMGIKDKNIGSEVVSLNRYDFRREDFPKDLKYILKDTQNTGLESNQFDYLVSQNAMPDSAHMGIVNIDGKIVEYQELGTLNHENQLAYIRQAKELTKNAINECLRITKPNGEMKFGMDMVVGQYEESNVEKTVHQAVDEGIIEACEGKAEIIKLPKPGEKYLYIIKRLSNDEKQKLESGTNEQSSDSPLNIYPPGIKPSKGPETTWFNAVQDILNNFPMRFSTSTIIIGGREISASDGSMRALSKMVGSWDIKRPVSETNTSSNKRKVLTDAEFYHDIDATIIEVGLSLDDVERICAKFCFTEHPSEEICKELWQKLSPVYFALINKGYSRDDLIT